MNGTPQQSPEDRVFRGILAAEAPTAAFYFCNARPGAAVIGQLLEAVALRAGRRALVLTRSEAAAETLSRGLWAYRRESFLPHGTADANLVRHPVLLTSDPERDNGADVLVLPDGEPLRTLAPDADAGERGPLLARFGLVLFLLDARDPAAIRAAAQSWHDARRIGYDTVAFGRDPPAGLRGAAPAADLDDLETPVPLRWHRLA